MNTQKSQRSGPWTHRDHLSSFGFAASGQAIFAAYVQQAEHSLKNHWTCVTQCLCTYFCTRSLHQEHDTFYHKAAGPKHPALLRSHAHNLSADTATVCTGIKLTELHYPLQQLCIQGCCKNTIAKEDKGQGCGL